MKNKLTIQYALQCIEELANEPLGRLSLQDLSSRRGIPTDACQDVLQRLKEAGILSADDQRRFGLFRPIEDITSLEVLEALWTERPHIPAFKVLYQRSEKALKKTLHAVWMAQGLGAFPGEIA